MSANSKPEFTKLDPPERSRTYIFGDVDGMFGMRIENVIAICVRPSGGHRLETAAGHKWIVPPGWIAVQIDADEWTF